MATEKLHCLGNGNLSEGYTGTLCTVLQLFSKSKIIPKEKEALLSKNRITEVFLPTPLLEDGQSTNCLFLQGSDEPKAFINRTAQLPHFLWEQVQSCLPPQLRSGCDKACRTGSGPLEASGDRGMESPSPGPELRWVGFLPPSFPSIPRPHPGSLCAV